jgi:hypothetical protein
MYDRINICNICQGTWYFTVNCTEMILFLNMWQQHIVSELNSSHILMRKMVDSELWTVQSADVCSVYAGNEYLDCINNVASVGHCHPRVQSAGVCCV